MEDSEKLEILGNYNEQKVLEDIIDDPDVIICRKTSFDVFNNPYKVSHRIQQLAICLLDLMHTGEGSIGMIETLQNENKELKQRIEKLENRLFVMTNIEGG